MPRPPLSIKTRVTDKDLGWKRVLKQAAIKRHVEVGVRGEDDPRFEGEIGNVELAAIHEFGLGHQDERSFIRDPIDANLPKYRLLTKRLGQRVYTLKMSLVQALNVLGLKAQSDMRRAIRAGIPPELSDETIDRKGSSKPLIDTGQLVSSLTYKVVR